MRKSYLLGATLALAVAACVGAEKSMTSHEHPASPVLSNVNDPAKVDTAELPDLIVDGSITEQHWVVRTEKLYGNFCSVIEGNVTPGERRIVRFTVTTPNIGKGDVFVGNPLDHADPNGDGDFSDSDGMFEFASCHNHFHFTHYATYKLVDEAGKVWKSAKRGFCMLDTDPNPAKWGEAPAGDRNYYSCGTYTQPGFQGVSHGWSDSYVFQLAGQYFVLDGGDGQPVVPPGNYKIVIEVNPAYAPAKRAGCPLVTDPATGMCHQFREADYTNNVGVANITIPAHNGKGGHGPEKNSPIQSTEPMKGQ